MENEQDQKNEQESSNKVIKQYQQTMTNINSILSGDTTVYKSKIANANVATAVEKLIKGRQEKAEAEFIEKMSTLLDKSIELDRVVDNLRKETEKAILAKKKEFNEEAAKVFKIMENVQELAKQYASKLSEKPAEESNSGVIADAPLVQ